MNAIHFTIQGQCYSLKNTRMIIPVKTIKGQPVEKGSKCPHCKKPLHMLTIANEKAQDFEEAFRAQLPKDAQQHLEVPVRVDIEIFYPSNRQDVDEALVLDLLQKFRVIENDRQVVAKYVEKRVDERNPRVVVQVHPVAWERSGKQARLLDDESVKPEVGAIV